MSSRESPIIFNSAMVRAVLDNHKTQTIRVIRPQPRFNGTWLGDTDYIPCIDENFTENQLMHKDKPMYSSPSPYGVPGDRLWVRETFGPVPLGPYAYKADVGKTRYSNSYQADGMKWKPSVHMPRWASRITLEITDVRVERVQDISDRDSLSEGISELPEEAGYETMFRHIHTFAALWDSINKKRGFGWHVNPWVWVVEFKRIEQ